MTLVEISQQLAREELAKTGVGLVSESTYKEIWEVLLPRDHLEGEPVPVELYVQGIRLIVNPFMPDGQIYPLEKWNLRDEAKRFEL